MLMHSADDIVAVPTVHAVAAGLVLAAWDTDPPHHSGRLQPLVDGAPVLGPFSVLALPTGWGGTRMIAALRLPERADLSFAEPGGRIVARVPAEAGAFDAAALTGGLGAAARVSLVQLLLRFCRSSFALKDDAGFAAACRQLLAQLAPTPAPLLPRVELLPGLVLCEGAIPRDLGRLSAVMVVGERSVRALPYAPLAGPTAEDAHQPIHLAVELPPGEDEALVVLLGRTSLSCRMVKTGAGQRPGLLAWIEGARPGVAQALREYVAACLARKAAELPAAAALAEEMQLLAPLPRRMVAVSAARPLGLDVEFAVGQGADGLFVAGWALDPHAMIAGLEAISPTGRRRVLDIARHRFPRPDIAPSAEGFVGYAPGGEAVPARQYRFEARLRSGTVLDLVAPPQPAGFVEARNAVLGSVPPGHLASQTLAEVVAPAAAALHANAMRRGGEVEVIRFGEAPARPAVSLAIPLYRNLEFLRFQVGAFAVDPAFAEAEVIYVLDSPEQRREVEHLLRGLNCLYGLPLTLAVMPANHGFAAASNAGGRLARGKALLFLNSDVIPDAPGWLAPMLASLAEEGVGAVGPKLLFDDESLQHAGLYFARDLLGRWINMHFYKGYPRDFAPACVARSVPGVTGAALMMPRRLFEQVGGFTEDYIIGDYEDSDLCLKIRAAGHDIRFQPAAELFHLERQSIQHHAGYMRGVACEYNRALHASRWDGAMAALEAGAPAPARKSRRAVA